jgi:hypothetical protein
MNRATNVFIRASCEPHVRNARTTLETPSHGEAVICEAMRPQANFGNTTFSAARDSARTVENAHASVELL